MKVEKQQVEKLRVTDIDGLDAIDIYLEKPTETSGKITVSCYGESWSGYWGGVGGTGFESFFKRAPHESIINIFDSKIPFTQPDWDAYKSNLKAALANFDVDDKEDVLEAIEMTGEDELQRAFDEMGYNETFSSYEVLLNEGIEDDVLELIDASTADVPMMPSYRFVYLSKIIDVVKQVI